MAETKMSEPKFDNEGFRLVLRKNASKRPGLRAHNELKNNSDTKINIRLSYRRILSAVAELAGSEYLSYVIKSVSNALKDKIIVEIICFGLGHIGESNISRFQLALLLCLRDQFNPEKVLVHDPAFFAGECELLKKFNLTLILENTEAKHEITNRGISLVYLPHCPKQLTNNFLWSNWGPNLQNCILIGNSFTTITEISDRIVTKTVPFIHRILPFTHEVILDNRFIYLDIFNNTSLHYFPKELLDTISSDFWNDKEQTEYTNVVEFITSLMVEKLTL